MYAIINPDTKEVLEFPIPNLRVKFPRTSFPKNPTNENLPPEIAMVDVKPQPTVGLTEKVVMDTPVYDPVFNTWSVDWTVEALTQEEVLSKYPAVMEMVSNKANEMLNAFAQERGYDGIISLCNYSTSADATFASDAAHGIATRDTTWITLRDFSAGVEAGTTPVPNTMDEILALIPPMTWA